MKKALFFTVIAALSFQANNSFATNAGLSIGGELGTASLDTPIKTPPGVNSFSYSLGDSISWGAYAAYNFALGSNFLLGAQLGYNNYRYSKYTINGVSAQVSSTAWDLLATGTYVFDSGFNLFAKAGIARVNQMIDQSPINNKNDIIQCRPELALGVGYNFVLPITVFAEYKHIFGDNQANFSDMINTYNNLSSVANVNAIYLGTSWTF